MAKTSRHEFLLVGGHPALDFINTVHDCNASAPRDYLREFADAIRFGEAVGLLNRGDFLRLRRRAAHNELTRLRELRAVLKRTLQGRRSGKAPSNVDLEKLSSNLAEAARASRLMAETRHRAPQVPLRREITVERAGDALLRLRIVESAVALLVSDAMLRVKSCPTCGWLFLDLSKNRSRRWCSMDACGGVAKARRHYRRLKERRNP